MRRILAIFTGSLLLGQLAAAGELSGKIQGLSINGSRPAVVWVEGIKHFNVPNNKPVIVQHKGEFTPAFLVVVAGQTVEMPNQDMVAHNVYSSSQAKQFDLGYYAEGEHKEVTFDRAGVVDLGCSIHTFMRGRILVVPNPYFAEVKANGSFQIRNIPAGSYVLKFWTDGQRELSEKVTVPEAGMAVVNLDLSATEVAVRK